MLTLPFLRRCLPSKACVYDSSVSALPRSHLFSPFLSPSPRPAWPAQSPTTRPVRLAKARVPQNQPDPRLAFCAAAAPHLTPTHTHHSRHTRLPTHPPTIPQPCAVPLPSSKGPLSYLLLPLLPQLLLLLVNLLHHSRAATARSTQARQASGVGLTLYRTAATSSSSSSTSIVV